MTHQPSTDTHHPDPAAIEKKMMEQYEGQLRFLRKWESGLGPNEAPKVLRHNREHPIVQAFVTVLRHWREEAMEELAEPNQPDAQLRERLGYVRALKDVEEGILTIQMEEGE